MAGRMKAMRVAHTDPYPSAECQEGGCSFTRHESSSTLDDVRLHCADTGHQVLVTRQVQSIYKGVPR